MQQGRERLLGLSGIITILSGAAALSHELLWTRKLIDLLGATTHAHARVFACFFLGLALGSAWSTRWVKTKRRPWRTLVWIEVGIALFSVPIGTLPYWSNSIWPWLGCSSLLGPMGSLTKIFLAFLLMIPPSFLMGITLPLLTSAVLGQQRTLGRQGVWLYALNTLGGVMGILWTSTVALPHLGIDGAFFLAVLLNLLAAVLSGILDHYQQARIQTKGPISSSSRTIHTPTPLLLLSFFSGAGVLATEVLGLHLFRQVAPSTLFSVASVLSVVILVLALAAFLAPYLFSSGRRFLVTTIGFLAIAGVLVALIPIVFMGVTNNMTTIKPSSNLFFFSSK